MKISKRAIYALNAMSQGDKPTRAEFLAAWEAGFIDITPKGLEAVRKSNADAYRAAKGLEGN